MINKCFICLDICRTRRCKICKLYAHKKCWKNFLYYSKDINCPQCNQNLKKSKRYNLRQNKILSSSEITNTIKDYLKKSECSRSISERKKICKNIYEILLHNKWFLHRYKVFNKVAKKKLEELIEINKDWTDGVELYTKIWSK